MFAFIKKGDKQKNIALKQNIHLKLIILSSALVAVILMKDSTVDVTVLRQVHVVRTLKQLMNTKYAIN